MNRQFSLSLICVFIFASINSGVFAQTDVVSDANKQVQVVSENEVQVPELPSGGPETVNQNPLAIGPGEKVIPTTEELGLLKAMNEAELKAMSAPYVRPDIRSLMFTPYQYSLLLEAQKGFNVNVNNKDLGVEDNPALIDQAAIGDQPKEDIKSIREIYLGGIVYNSEKLWTIYFNGERVTLKNVPKEAVNLKVSKDYIDLLWLDRQTNKIFPVRLRANQRFNLDSGLFLPGKSG